ncbi:putative CRISPR-associated protein [Vibrio halioticoli NBRC 102217]|uniref:Putative CRISPR-associated protein n=1 Tax=Vibrio halioticoli NBRC 102217 TaxID=1219072 RepID=V5FJQ5_9VIBR|nr:CRISPR-associated protein [Vibrio halioticoli]GAD89981.1 putative CRISPR-associated protein [Vibrio halioticoli NBRC 102217]
MYQKIYQAYNQLATGDRAQLKRSNLKNMRDLPAYFRVLKYTGLKDNQQTLRILFLLVALKINSDQSQADTVAKAMIKAEVKEHQVNQIVRSGENGLEYLKRQLIRCDNLCLDSVGQLAQYWGDNTRRNLLKTFILEQQD